MAARERRPLERAGPRATRSGTVSGVTSGPSRLAPADSGDRSCVAARYGVHAPARSDEHGIEHDYLTEDVRQSDDDARESAGTSCRHRLR